MLAAEPYSVYGCGTGWAVGQVAKLADNKGEFYGVDLLLPITGSLRL
jgi:hypothetical protein